MEFLTGDPAVNRLTDGFLVNWSALGFAVVIILVGTVLLASFLLGKWDGLVPEDN